MTGLFPPPGSDVQAWADGLRLKVQGDQTLRFESLSAQAFAPFGEVIDATDRKPRMINGGRTQRFHALAEVQTLGEDGAAIISIFRGEPLGGSLLDLMERHPLGSQSFMPLNDAPFIVIVAPPGDFDRAAIRAFLVEKHQGVNFRPGTWHAPLLPLRSDSDYLVVDRVGGGNNCDEVVLDPPLELIASIR